MRRTPAITLGFAAFFLTLAPLQHGYVLPRVRLAPLGIDVTDVSTGAGTFLDPATGRVTGPATITVTRRILGDVDAGHASGKAVWDVATRVDTPATLTAADPRKALSSTVTRWVFDPRTNVSAACCGADPLVTGDGYLKYPFGLGRHSYLIWDATAGKAFEARFAGVQTVSGHEFYRFTMTVPPTRIGAVPVPGAVLGRPDLPGFVNADEYYANPEETTLVDPATGAPVSGSSHIRVTLRVPGEAADRVTALDVTVSSTPDSAARMVASAVANSRKLAFVGTTGPIAATALGTVLAVAGGVSALRRSPTTPAPIAPAPPLKELTTT